MRLTVCIRLSPYAPAPAPPPLRPSPQVVDTVKTFLFAGHDTTAATLTWALYELAKAPALQDRVRGEVLCGTPSDCPPDPSSLGTLELLNAVVKEVLRLHPPAIFSRNAPRPTSVDVDGVTYVFPQKCEVLIVPWLLHRRGKYFRDPEAFAPDRWLGPDRAEDFSFPFSSGPRNCIGMNLALLEIQAALCHFLRHFAFRVDPAAAPPDTVCQQTLFPVGVSLIVERREEHVGPSQR